MNRADGFRNPLTGHLVLPGTVLGYRRDGRPILLAAGGSGEGGDGGQSGGQAGAGNDGQGGADQGGQPDGSGQLDGQQAGRLEDLPEWAQKVVRDARAGEAKARTEAKAQAASEAAEQARQDLAQQIGKALGLVKDGESEQPDPGQLTQQLTQMADTNKALTVELAVWKAAKKAGANAQALTDSRSFIADVAKLDPAGGDFTTKLGEAITKALADNPNYREAGQAPLRSGGEFTGGPGVSDREPATPAERLRRGYANQT